MDLEHLIRAWSFPPYYYINYLFLLATKASSPIKQNYCKARSLIKAPMINQKCHFVCLPLTQLQTQSLSIIKRYMKNDIQKTKKAKKTNIEKRAATR